MLKHIYYLGIWLFGINSLFGQNNASFTLPQIMSAPFPTSLVASSQSDYIAWVSNQEGQRSIWVVDQPGNTPKQMAVFPNDDGQAISQLSFTPNGQKLTFVRGGAPNRQGYIPNPAQAIEKTSRTIQILDCTSQTMHQVGMGTNPTISPDGKTLIYIKRGDVWKYDLDHPDHSNQVFFHSRGGVSQLRWAPNGQKVAFVSRRGTHSFIGVYDIAQKELSYLSPGLYHDEDPAWSPDGSRLAFRRTPNERDPFLFIPRRSGNPWSIVIYDFDQNKAQQIWTASAGVGSVFRNISSANQLFWMADDQIIFPWEGDGWTHLYRISANGGQPTLITSGNFEVQYVSCSGDRRHIIWSANQDDLNRQHIWQATSPAYQPLILSKGNGIEWSPVMTGKTKEIYALGSTAKHPAAPVNIKNGEVSFMADFQLPSNFPQKLLVDPEPVTFTATDGLVIHGQLFKPPNWDDGQKRPALLFFHGGSKRQMLLGFHHRGYYHNAYAMNQYLANHGYFVLSVNYRSGIGYGMAFREALNYGAAGASEFNDVMGAGLYLSNLDGVDKDKLGLWGGSYGGYLTALGLAKASDLFKAGVDIHGVHDWNVVIQNFRPQYVPEQYPAFAQTAFNASPMAFLDTWQSPVLIIHGDDDRNVPFSESVDLAESLHDRNIYFEQLVFPDEVHGFLLHQNWLKAYEATADFFDRMLKQP